MQMFNSKLFGTFIGNMISVLCRTPISILFFTTAVSSSESYNEFFNVSGSVVTSPNFPLEYNNNITYKYLVQAPSSCLIKLTFVHFEVENNKDIPYLCRDTLKIYDKRSENDSVLLWSLCGPYLPSPVFSSSNVIDMIFETDTTVARSGFKAYITFLRNSSRDEGYKIDAVRLNGGQSSGRVEFLVKDQWGPVCGENWSINTANLVCLDIGYDFAVQATSQKFWVTPHNLAPIFNLTCIENAEKLSSCVVDGNYAGSACPNWNLAEIVCGSNIVTTYSLTESPKHVISISSNELVVMSTAFLLLVVFLGLVAMTWRMWCKRRRRSEELALFQQRPQRNPATMVEMLEFFIMNEQMRRGNGPALPARRPHAQLQQIRATVETPSTSDVFVSNPHLNPGCSDTLTSLRSDDVFSRISDETISRLTTLERGRGSCSGPSNLEPDSLKTRLTYLSIADDSDDADACSKTDNCSTNLSKSIERRDSEDTVYEKIC